MKLLALAISLILTVEVSFGNFVENYAYPEIDSLESSLMFEIIRGKKKGKKIYMGKNIGLALPDAYHGNNRFNYRLKKQKFPAPLVFMNVGLGGGSTDGAARYLSDILFGQGFHVVTLRSTFTDEFAALAGSSPYVGQARIDAYDLYVKMLGIKRQLEQKKLPVTDYGFMGFSFGALVGSFVTKIDDREGHFNFKKVVLINPPVDLLYGLKQLDYYHDNFARKKFGKKVGLLLRYNRYDQIVRREGFNPNLHKQRLATARLSSDDIAALVGLTFRSTLKDVLLFSQLTENVGIIPMERGEAMKRKVGKFNYNDYVTRFIPKFYKETLEGKLMWKKFYGNNKISVKFLNRQNSLKATESTLSNNKRVVVLHNADDFLIRENDAAYIRQVLKNRLFLFKRGGHLGNLWHPRFHDVLIEQWQLAF